jgi:hypothetical protein
MAGYLQLAQAARAANARIRTARELDARWRALGPEGQAEARVEWENLKAALTAVRTRMEHGPRGFAREFSAAYRGEESAPVAEPRSLGELVGELHVATNAMRAKLDAVEQTGA